MTLNILVSFSLLALVVTARPISNASQPVKRSLQVQNAVQAFLASRTGRSPDCLTCDDDQDVHVSLTSSEEQSLLLSTLDDLDDIKAVIPLNVGGSPAEDEKQLYDILAALKSTGPLDHIDGDISPVDSQQVENLPDDQTTPDDPSQDFPPIANSEPFSPPAVVLAVSCIAALLAVLCVGVALYAYNHVNKIILKTGLSWDLLPRLEQRIGLAGPANDNNHDNDSVQPGKRNLLAKLNTPLPPDTLVFAEVLDEKLDEKSALVDVEGPLSGDEDSDANFYDAPESSLLFFESIPSPQRQTPPDVPRIVVESHADPDLLPLPDLPTTESTPFSTPLPTPLRSPLPSPSRSPSCRSPQMRELQTSPTPLSKPLWSLRAADAPSLGLTGVSSPSSGPASRSESPDPQLQVPGALFMDDAPELLPQRPSQNFRVPRQPIDIAFALQLRPGLGLGADSAWLVRFMMAMFGWMTFVIGGGPRREDGRRALLA